MDQEDWHNSFSQIRCNENDINYKVYQSEELGVDLVAISVAISCLLWTSVSFALRY